MADWRASEDALRRLYLGGKIGGGGLPSDAWTQKGNFNGIVVGDSEGSFSHPPHLFHSFFLPGSFNYGMINEKDEY